ncbi:DUF418 domain-containing protein [Saccharopolyspora sp. 7B]|uniref:DUF418 domain-containing protein n=1 Tax=Saccharopolyspora sp. 7B TaxID=2877240 RepID=UPI001CD727F4|nr:DUF418 domain-containing protein [Saccharopolyspora sp. 7B]MCA1281848.1 DUF418 domain-containing protein [Saccharopolyspora sp. 7B]
MSTTGISSQKTERISRPGTGRLIGVDIARGLVVLGMFVAHTGPPQSWLFGLVSGRSAALFAVLAGLSIALLSGGTAPVEGVRRRQVAVRIAVRAVVLFGLGLVLSMLDAPVMVILTSYGVLFLLALPLLRLRARTLGVLAGVLAIAAPLASYLIRDAMPPAGEFGAIPHLGDFTSWSGAAAAFQHVLLDGGYPVLTWLPFVLAGMALGRIDLRAARGPVALLGAGLALAGYGGSWLAMNVFGGREQVLASYGDALPPELVDVLLSRGFGAVPTGSPVMLLSAGAHSGSPFEVVGATGAALLVIGLCMFVERARVLAPIAAVGALALTAYAGHIVLLAAIGTDGLMALQQTAPHLTWLLLTAIVVVFAVVWRALLGRGPLERVLHLVSAEPAARIGR